MITLVPFTRELAMSPRYLGWLNDKSLMRYSEQRHREHDVDSAIGYFCRMEDAGNPFWAVMDGDRHVGNVAAYIDRANNVADLSILIGEPGCGFGFAAWEMALARLDVRKVEAGTMETNFAMLRIFEKSWMHPDGRKARHFVTDDVLAVDLVQFCLFK